MSHSMRYLSTRGGDERLTFEQAVLRGLAPNGGLYIPDRIPTLPDNWQSEWAELPFAHLSHRILSLFVPSSPEEGGIPSDELLELLERSYSTFRSELVSPLRRLGDREWCLELWHGPTFAFKDVALQTLGNLFEYFLKRRNHAKKPDEPRDKLTVVGATSGDTGSAAIFGLRSKEDISIFILHPKGRVSPIQEAQMTTVLDANVHNLAVEGTFDDCQDIVKALFSDADFNGRHKLGAINSINFARILAQIVYYFSAYFQILRQEPHLARPHEQLQFVVPTGNFGDVLAGYYAKRMGLPMATLVVATNENDILPRFWASGRYEKLAEDAAKAERVAGHAAQGANGGVQTAPVQGSSDGKQAGGNVGSGGAAGQVVGGVKATLSPAMDILVSSNFERLLWYIAYETAARSTPAGGKGDERASAGASGEEADRVRAAGERVRGWMEQLKSQGRMQVDERQLGVARRDFAALRVSDEETKATILRYFQREASVHRPEGGYLVDPHTAVGFHAAHQVESSSSGSVASTSSSTSPSAAAASGSGLPLHQVVLATAHPAKFAEAVTSSLTSAGASFDFERDVLPREMHGLLERPRRVQTVSPLLPEAGADGGAAGGAGSDGGAAATTAAPPQGEGDVAAGEERTRQERQLRHVERLTAATRVVIERQAEKDASAQAATGGGVGGGVGGDVASAKKQQQQQQQHKTVGGGVEKDGADKAPSPLPVGTQSV